MDSLSEANSITIGTTVGKLVKITVTEEAVFKCIGELKCGKTPGVDEISSDLLLKL